MPENSIYITKSIIHYSFNFIWCRVRCDRGRFAEHSPVIEKSMSVNISGPQLLAHILLYFWAPIASAHPPLFLGPNCYRTSSSIFMPQLPAHILHYLWAQIASSHPPQFFAPIASAHILVYFLAPIASAHPPLFMGSNCYISHILIYLSPHSFFYSCHH